MLEPKISLDLVDSLRAARGLEYAIETGTLGCGTTVNLATRFEKVWTVELSQQLYANARRTLAEYPNVKPVFTSSHRGLAEICKQLDKPTLFWLDAHYSGGGTAKGATECPLLDELHAIGGSDVHHVILIDDARMFLAPPPKEHKASDWPTLDDIKAAVGAWGMAWQVTVLKDKDIIAVSHGPLDSKPANVSYLRANHSYVFNEVAVLDVYRLRQLHVTPELVVDVGANVGSFSAHAHSLFPHAEIVAVEPHPSNQEAYLMAMGGVPRVTLHKAAIGQGQVFFHDGARPGNHVYISETVGYSAEALARSGSHRMVSVPTIMLDDLVCADETRPYIVKIDCEAAEACLIDHKPSCHVIRGAEYVAMELHFYSAEHERDASHGTTMERVLNAQYTSTVARLVWLYMFANTHTVEIDLWPGGGMAFLKKRRTDGSDGYYIAEHHS